MNNLTIEQKAELMDILLNDSVIKNRIDNILNSKIISTSIDENNNVHFINNNKKISIRLLSLDEYNKYIVNGTADGSVTKNDMNVWHYSLFITMEYGEINVYRFGTQSMYFECTNNNTLSQANVFFNDRRSNLRTRIWDYGGRSAQDLCYTTPSLTNKNFSSTLVYNEKYCGFIEYSSFRPAFQIKDTDKSIDLFQ